MTKHPKKKPGPKPGPPKKYATFYLEAELAENKQTNSALVNRLLRDHFNTKQP